jgi:hypothetical protein
MSDRASHKEGATFTHIAKKERAEKRKKEKRKTKKKSDEEERNRKLPAVVSSKQGKGCST